MRCNTIWHLAGLVCCAVLAAYVFAHDKTQRHTDSTRWSRFSPYCHFKKQSGANKVTKGKLSTRIKQTPTRVDPLPGETSPINKAKVNACGGFVWLIQCSQGLRASCLSETGDYRSLH